MAKRRTSLEVANDKAALYKARAEALLEKKRFEELSRAYDAAKTSELRPRRGGIQSADTVMNMASTKLLQIARWLDENHDLSIGILDDLVNKIVGTGIKVTPQIKDKNGKLHEEANKTVKRLLKDQARARIEASRTIPDGELDRLICRAWLRDGDAFMQHVMGNTAMINHRGPLPYSLELIECEMLPFELTQGKTEKSPRIIHGISMNDWREPIAFNFLKEHPGDFIPGSRFSIDTKAVPANLITHLKLTRRFNQARGVTIFHGVLSRLEDIKEYEESERIAARVAAAMTGVIRKSGDYASQYSNLDYSAAGQRLMEMTPGMIFDNLLPGEDIGMIDSNRPNPNLGNFRQDQMRAAASGTGTNASSITKNYNGTFSSQRQELVENRVNYDRARNYFIDTYRAERHRNEIDLIVLAGKLPLLGIDLDTIYDADYQGPTVPWIDPQKEMAAHESAIRNKVRSRHQIIREYGGDPAEVDEEIKADPFVNSMQGDLFNEKSDPENAGDEDETENADDEVAA